jgi:chemotaxis signal transduction protein
MRVLAFHSGDERYLVRLDAVRAVVRLRGMRRLPGSVGALVGVLDVQETPVAIYDSRGSRRDGTAEPGGDVLVLASGWPDNAIGVACDGVEELIELIADDAPIAAGFRSARLPGYVEAMLRVDGTLVPLVDAVGLAEAAALG